MRLRRPTIGQRAPGIDLAPVDGGRWILAEQAGHPVVVIFHRHIH